MNEINLYKKTQDAMKTLYQNKEVEGLKKVQELLPEYQSVVQGLLDSGKETEALLYFSSLKVLVKHFQEQNMIGMADCLDELLEWGR